MELKKAQEGPLAYVNEVVVATIGGGDRTQEMASGVEYSDHRLVAERYVEFDRTGIVGEGDEADVVVQGNASESFAGEVVAANVGGIAVSFEDEQVIVFLIVSDAGGRALDILQ
jgi:hypothetical protein